MTYTQKRLEEFDEQIEEMVKQTTYGLICEVCGGGGMFEDLVCKKCEGHGIHTWRTNHLGEKIKSFLATKIQQAVAEEREEVIKEIATKLNKMTNKHGEGYMSAVVDVKRILVSLNPTSSSRRKGEGEAGD